MKKFLRITIYVVAVVVLLFIGVGIGSSGAKGTVDAKTMNITELEKKISDEQNQLKSVDASYQQAKSVIAQKADAQKQLNDLQSKLSDTKATLDKELADGKKDIDNKLAGENKQLSDAQAKVSDLQGQIASKQNQLNSLNGQILKASGTPKDLGAGEYIIGQDIPAGRYIAHALGTGSNFIVYDSSGMAKVNTILGNSDGIGSGDYTFFGNAGDKIETHEAVELTPVQ